MAGAAAMKTLAGWAIAAVVATSPARADPPITEQPITEQPIARQREALAAGTISAERLTRLYLAAVAAKDRAGPALHSVIAVNPNALAMAGAVDAARARHEAAGPLAGIVILVKDNIETADPIATTAGSLAMTGNITGRDSPAIARLRAAGAVILGKTNLSEWANVRSFHGLSGWSAAGGYVKNPYVLDRSPCGSSAGSAAAVAAGLASAAIGTETDGSITCPSSLIGLVGLKPTVGLVSRTYVVPISSSQDTPGPMARTVADAAALLSVIAGSDPADPATAQADARKTDYVAALAGASLKGKRLGIVKSLTGYSPGADALLAQAVAALKARGAEVIEIADYTAPAVIDADETLVLQTELKATMNAYLAGLPAAVKTRTLADVIAFDKGEPRESALFADDFFEQAQASAGLADPAYLKARAEGRRLAGPEGIDKLLADHRLDALIAPTEAPAWRIDTVDGDHFLGSATGLAAVAGYPHLTVPMGEARGLPVGLSFIGPAWSEAALLRLGYAYEQATHMRKRPRFIPSVDE